MTSCPVCQAPLPETDMKDRRAGDRSAFEAARRQIGTEMLEVHEASYGTGAENVKVHILDDLVIVWLNELELSVAERTLIEGGEARTVLRTRAAFQEAIEPTVTAIVERATGRRVANFLSTTILGPPCSVELFRLHPGGDPGLMPNEPR